MALITLRNLKFALGGPPLFREVNLTVEEGQHICLTGRNGAGKTTLLHFLNGNMQPDDGEIIRAQGLHTVLLEQQVPRDIFGSVFSVVAAGLGDKGLLLQQFHDISAKLALEHAQGGENSAVLERELDRIQYKLDQTAGWETHRTVESMLSRTGLDGDALFENLSAGWKRRVLFAQALVAEPDILLLDEPTNHLDISSITWLEDFLTKYEKTVLFVTHDRMFLRHVANRILELDRGELYAYDCDYDTFLQRRELRLNAEMRENEVFYKKLAQEEIWIRTGIMARRTRNEGRVRSLQKMRHEAQMIRKNPARVNMLIQDAQKTGRMVISAQHLSFSYDNNTIVNDFTFKVMRGDRIALMGPNGAGKTTLLRLLLGELTPVSGDVQHGTKLEVAYFDQLHAQLDLEKSVAENVADGASHVTINGKKQHITGYLENFLFTRQRSEDPVKNLSGGERNRLLLARLFTKPSNLLVMDEPTNDLDAETLELLEEHLGDYSGTLLLVSHDREFINNVVTNTLVFEGNGVVHDYAGGYDDWLIQRKEASEGTADRENSKNSVKNASGKSASTTEKEGTHLSSEISAVSSRRLTYKEKMELEALPSKISELEQLISDIHQRMSDPKFYQQTSQEISAQTQHLTQLQAQLEAAYLRWEELER